MPAPSEILIYSAQAATPIRCQSIAEMDDVLDRLHAEVSARLATDPNGCPLSVAIMFAGHEIAIGLGSNNTFVYIGSEPFDDWYAAIGDPLAQGDDKMFYGFHQDTYWPPSHLIPVAAARDAVRHFVEHQERRVNLAWPKRKSWEHRFTCPGLAAVWPAANGK